MAGDQVRRSAWDVDRDGGSLRHVNWLAREHRHTKPNDDWFRHAEAKGWAIAVPGVMESPWFRVLLTEVGRAALEREGGA